MYNFIFLFRIHLPGFSNTLFDLHVYSVWVLCNIYGLKKGNTDIIILIYIRK